MSTSVSLVGRHALVTGASRGIGRAIAQTLAIAGARVTLVARDVDALQDAAREIGANATVAACDLCDTCHRAKAMA